MKRGLLCAAVAAALAIAAFAGTFERRHHGEFGFRGISAELSDEQKERLNALRAARLESFKNADRSGEGADFAAAFRAEAFDRAAFVSAANAKAAARIEQKADFLAELHAILTPQQREAFAKRFEQKADRFDHRRHGGANEPDPDGGR
ncbi:MAG: Spy/CpxP family protein refolding chaperone [Helicobacteraceae bacterium]|jgi:Spy/CpxP family protein refolding chaperone|nr:Spy/CpxP family protein refolding chaperone [Helicobacteraceae bacterium]